MHLLRANMTCSNESVDVFPSSARCNASKYTQKQTIISLMPNRKAHSVWKLLKMSHLNFLIWAFSTNFCPIHDEPLSIQKCRMRLFLWFSNIVQEAFGSTVNSVLKSPENVSLLTGRVFDISVTKSTKDMKMRHFWYFQTLCSAFAVVLNPWEKMRLTHHHHPLSLNVRSHFDAMTLMQRFLYFWEIYLGNVGNHSVEK